MKFLELVAVNKKEANVIMFGSVSQWSSLSASRMYELIQQAESDGIETLNLLINSPGGSIFEGIAIYNILKSFKTVTVVGDVVGMAASMASAILMGCDKVRMGKGSRLMIHSGSSGVYGSASEIISHGKLLESLNTTISEMYAEKTGKESSWIQENWMKDGTDTWFTADQARIAGLIDEEYGSKVKSAAAEASFDQISAHYADQVDSWATNDHDDMKFNFFEKFPKLSALVGDEQEISNEAIAAVNEELTAKGVKGVVLTTSTNLESLQAELETALANIMNAIDHKHSGAVTSEVIASKIKDLKDAKEKAEAQAKAYGKQPGAKPTTPENPNPDNQGEAYFDAEIAALPHNAALENNPLYN